MKRQVVEIPSLNQSEVLTIARTDSAFVNSHALTEVLKKIVLVTYSVFILRVRVVCSIIGKIESVNGKTSQ